MFKRILWATDGSANAEYALPVARSLAAEAGATLSIVHVVQRIVTTGGLAWHADEEDAVSRVRQIERELSAAGLEVSLKIIDKVGIQPAPIIADVARSLGSDLVVVGTRGQPAPGGLLIGTVSQRLLHLSPCPVLAVPPDSQGYAVAPAGEHDAAIYLG